MNTRSLIALAIIAAPLIAHSLYLMPAKFHPAPGEQLVFSVHNGDAFPDSEDSSDPTRFINPRLTSATAQTPITDFKRLGKATHSAVAIPAPGAYWLSLQTKPRVLSLEPAKFEDYLRAEGLDWVVAWRAQHKESAIPSRERYSKYAKSFLSAGPGDTWNKVLGLAIEIVPEADPAALKPGSQLPVRLLWHGKPAAGVRLERAWATPDGKKGVEPVGFTDKQGRLSIPFDKAGRWRIHAVAMERAPQGDPEADWISYWASMTLEVR